MCPCEHASNTVKDQLWHPKAFSVLALGQRQLQYQEESLQTALAFESFLLVVYMLLPHSLPSNKPSL